MEYKDQHPAYYAYQLAELFEEEPSIYDPFGLLSTEELKNSTFAGIGKGKDEYIFASRMKASATGYVYSVRMHEDYKLLGRLCDDDNKILADICFANADFDATFTQGGDKINLYFVLNLSNFADWRLALRKPGEFVSFEENVALIEFSDLLKEKMEELKGNPGTGIELLTTPNYTIHIANYEKYNPLGEITLLIGFPHLIPTE